MKNFIAGVMFGAVGGFSAQVVYQLKKKPDSEESRNLKLVFKALPALMKDHSKRTDEEKFLIMQVQNLSL